MYGTIEYINSRLDKKIKHFQTAEEFNSFIELLDKRIDKKTCYGYLGRIFWKKEPQK